VSAESPQTGRLNAGFCFGFRQSLQTKPVSKITPGRLPSINNSTEQSPFLEASSSSAGHEIPCICWTPEIYYLYHSGRSLVPILSQINPIYTLPSCFSSFYLDIALLSTLRPSKLYFSSGFRTTEFFYLTQMCHVSSSCHLPLCDHQNNI